MKYDVISGDRPRELVEAVNHALDRGAILQGGVAADGSRYYQAVVYDEAQDEAARLRTPFRLSLQSAN